MGVKTHEMNAWTDEYAELRNGKKPFVTSAEFKNVEAGDTLRVYEDAGEGMPERTGRWILFDVTYAIIWSGGGISIYICAVGKPVAYAL